MPRLNDLSVGKRLGLSFLLVMVLIAGSVGIGLWSLASEHDISQRIDHLEQVEDDIQTFAYHVADVTGWQGLVVADAGAIGGRAATRPGSYNRAGELESKKSLYATLDGTHTQYMTPAERALFKRLRPAWDEFFVWDDKIMTWLLKDTRAARAAALTSINDGAAGDAWTEGVEISTALDTSLDRRMERLRAEAVGVRATGLRVLLLTLVGSLALAVLLSVVATRSVVRPLRVVTAVLRRVAGGDLTVRAELSRRDELGVLGDAVDQTTSALTTTMQTLTAHSAALATASDRLGEVAGQIDASALETSAQAEMVTSAAGEVSRNVETVAAGGEQMGASIREIARNTSEAASVATEAVAAAAETSTLMARLGTSSTEISDVVRLINSIAAQTNLLALNATIEAARAGDAGKGFAVVAGEVKELAQETADATKNITGRITMIQADVEQAVGAIDRISTITGRINDYQATIASAVEEQSVTTGEMNRNVSGAAESSSEIAANIASVARAATETTDGVGASRKAAAELSEMSRGLRDLVGRFTY